MLLNATISGILCVLSTCAILAKIVPDLRASVLAYGKLSGTADIPRSKWVSRLAACTVPKSYFAHFYLGGLVFGLYCGIELALLKSQRPERSLGPLLDLLRRWDSSRGSHRVEGWKCLVGLGLMTCHLARRLLECWLVERPSPSARMHVSHYFLGLGFYGAMVFGTWLEGVGDLSLWGQGNAIKRTSNFKSLITLFSLDR
jgi:3-oxo-5-alpha-steroid 4-dehydrogenase 3